VPPLLRLIGRACTKSPSSSASGPAQYSASQRSPLLVACWLLLDYPWGLCTLVVLGVLYGLR
jgi:hypothetical protein